MSGAAMSFGQVKVSYLFFSTLTRRGIRMASTLSASRATWPKSTFTATHISSTQSSVPSPSVFGLVGGEGCTSQPCTFREVLRKG